MPSLARDFRSDPAKADAQSMAVLRHDAEWADTFDNPEAPDTPNNLATRRTYNQDRSAYAAALLEQQSQRQADLIQRDKTAQDFFFRTERLNMDREKADWALQERNQRMQFERQKLPLDLESKRASAAASRALEVQRTRGDVLKATIEARKAEHTDGVQSYVEGMLSNGVHPGTEQYAYGLAEARTKFPAVDTAYFDDLWKTTNSKLPAADAFDLFRKARAEVPDANVSVRTGDATLTTPRPTNQPAASDSGQRQIEGQLRSTLTQYETEKAKQDALGAGKENLAVLAQHERNANELRGKLGLPATDYAIKKVAERLAKDAGADKPQADEKVSVVSPDGKTGRIPRSQLEAALAAGYKAK